MIRALILPLLVLSAPTCHADMLTCSDGAGHQFMISQGDADHLEGLNCQPGRNHRNSSKPFPVQPTPASLKTAADMHIAPEVQKARDNDRRGILEDELRSEQAVLDGEVSQRDGTSGERRQNLDQQIHRTEQNIAALNRELARSR